MNQLDYTGPIPEFGTSYGAHWQRRIAMTLIALICVMAFAYDAFPLVAHIVHIITVAIVIMAALALTIAGIVITTKGGV